MRASAVLWLVLCLYGALSAPPLLADVEKRNEAPRGSSVADVVDLLLKRDCPLGALAAAETIAATGSLPSGFLEQVQAIVGDDPSVQWSRQVAVPANCERAPGDWKAVEALAEIGAVLRDTPVRVVILNESHQTRMHRVFAFQVLQALRPMGFDALAGETFSRGIATTLEDGAPDAASGFYTVDPAFADLVRVAHHQGVTLFGYDFSDDGAETAAARTPVEHENARSAAQARNITAFLERHPDARVLVIAGSGHGAKLEQQGIRRLAMRLQDDFAIPVLSIDQVFGTPVGGAYRLGGECFAVDDFALETPSALRLGDRRPAREGFDLTVFHPRSERRHGRPQWITMGGQRRLEALRLDARPERSLVRAFMAGEPEGSIAIDQVVVPAGETSASMALPAVGDVRFVREDEQCRKEALLP